jgi:2-polyprenyl-3-methyl-5-hydroxy-6-metoxy-1,4-benzoquinol methylase
LSQSNFELKNVLDIGCGTGKYLKILQVCGFKTDGIDSSETAVEMTKKVLGDNPTILCVNMFEFEIPKNKYDLVISISTIHHGRKDQVQNLINIIYEAIVENGKIFITVPDFESSKKWNTFKDHKEVAEGTFAPLLGPEKGLPHSFYTKEEAQKLFSRFRDLQLDLDGHGRWVAQASK